MELTTLELFLEVVRRGSFAAVARDRGVDPSSVSRAMTQLEAELGVRLLHRTTRRLALTEAGAVYFDRMEPLLEELDGARLRALDLHEQPQGVLRVLAPVSFALLNIVPHLTELAERYPRLHFDLRLSDALLDLVEERIDLAIRLGPLEDSRLVARRLSPMRSVVCASPAYVERQGRPEKPGDLAQHDCLLLDMPGFGHRWRFRGPVEEEAEVPVRGRLRTSNAVALKQCALAGMGIILQARWIVGRELREGTLVDLFPDLEVTGSTFDNSAWMLYPSRTYMPLKLRVFMEFLEEKFRGGPPWDREEAGLDVGV